VVESPENEKLTDEGLYCPMCGYNLTGLPDDICPECGSQFDRLRLASAVSVGLVPLMPWEQVKDEKGGAWRAFWSTAFISCGQPQRFAAAFSVLPPDSRSMGFFLICLSYYFLILVLVAVIFDLTGIMYAPSSVQRASADVCSLFLSVPICQFFLQWFLAASVPQPDKVRRVGPWRSILHYSSAHLLVMPGFMAIVYAIAPSLVDIAMFRPFWQITIPASIGTACLWLFTLRPVFAARGGERGPLAMFLAMIASFAGISCGILVIEYLFWL
jgi:hypothetical protein